MTSPFIQRSPESIYEELVNLRAQIIQDSDAIISQWSPIIRRRAYVLSVRNLAHYMALRRHDLRPIQRQLTVLGLSSLGRSEARVMPTLTSVSATLARVASLKNTPP